MYDYISHNPETDRTTEHERPSWWTQASDALSNSDPVMAGLVERYPDIQLRTRGAAFATLARSIVSQQISVKAAESIWNRLIAVCECSPLGIIGASEAGHLQTCGLSVRKQEYLVDLAQQCANGRLDIPNWQQADDETVVATLTTIRGIGRWTAEMFLIFNLRRPDVFPVDDIGMQRALSRYYFDGKHIPLARIRDWGEQRRPWRTAATCYLWRSLDPIAVAY